MLIGHSAGSTQILAALTRQPPPSATGAILISLTYFGQGSAPYETREDTARARIKAGDDTPELDVYSLDFCKRFVTTPENLLSYSRWSRQHTLEALQRLGVAGTVVVGSADQRMDVPWIQALEASGLRLISIDGAY